MVRATLTLTVVCAAVTLSVSEAATAAQAATVSSAVTSDTMDNVCRHARQACTRSVIPMQFTPS